MFLGGALIHPNPSQVLWSHSDSHSNVRANPFSNMLSVTRCPAWSRVQSDTCRTYARGAHTCMHLTRRAVRPHSFARTRDGLCCAVRACTRAACLGLGAFSRRPLMPLPTHVCARKCARLADPPCALACPAARIALQAKGMGVVTASERVVRAGRMEDSGGTSSNGWHA